MVSLVRDRIVTAGRLSAVLWRDGAGRAVRATVTVADWGCERPTLRLVRQGEGWEVAEGDAGTRYDYGADAIALVGQLAQG